MITPRIHYWSTQFFLLIKHVLQQLSDVIMISQARHTGSVQAFQPRYTDPVSSLLSLQSSHLSELVFVINWIIAAIVLIWTVSK